LIQNFIELWRYRSLIVALVVRHLSMRYRGSVLGFFWSFLNPLCLMLVYTLVFKFYMRFDKENYAIFLFCGLLPWLWVTSALAEGTSSITASGHLITKSMFPAQVLPTVAVLTNMIHFLLALPLLFLFMFIAGMPLYYTWFLLPILVVLQSLLLQGVVLLLSAVNVKYRDVQHVVGNLLTFLFFLCPVLYPIEQVPERFRFTLNLNPFAALTTCYHSLILDGVVPSWNVIAGVVVFCFFFLWLGNFVFNKCREGFAEML